MHGSDPLVYARSLWTPLALCLGALFAGFTTASLGAQKLIADYELLTDLKDATTTHANVMLTGNPTPPAPPANGVCVNGIYRYNPKGQDVRTPNIASLDSTDFQLDVEFRLKALPTAAGAPVLMGGNGWRWIGIDVTATGTVGIKYNNSNNLWSKTKLALGKWYSASLQYERGVVRLYLDGLVVLHHTSVPTLNTGNNKNFTTNDFSNGRNHHGCIRRLRVWNDANLKGGQFIVAGSRCGNLRMRGAQPWPTPLKPYHMTMTGGAANSATLIFLGFRLPKAMDLTGLGAPGCTWFVNPIVIQGLVADAKGAVSLFLPIPNLVGLPIWFQWMNRNPTANSFGWTLSDYATMVIGS
jgi:hypothetical protein